MEQHSPPFPSIQFFRSFTLHNVTGIMSLLFLPFYFSAVLPDDDDDGFRVGYRIYRFACDLYERQFYR